jgi:hypothetical protein
VLISGGQLPKLLHDHLQALVDTKTVSFPPPFPEK